MVRALAVFAMLSAACAYECNVSTCGAGCCDQGICFEGTHERNAVQCGSVPPPTLGCASSYSACNPKIGLYCCAGSYCHKEECRSCNERGEECRTGPYTTPCCPGLSCQLKPGFSSTYACQ